MPIDLDQYRQTSHTIWNRIATHWAAERTFIYGTTGAVSDRMVELLAPRPGDTVLDLAAGTGETGYRVLDRIGPGGRLISTDFAPAMVDAARKVGAELGLEGVEYRVLDAEKMDLDDNSFDGVLCRFGYMLMADPAAALAETRRVLRDGGRLSFAVFGAPDRNPWASIPGLTLVRRGHLPPPEPGRPGIFAMADPGRIRELVTGAGFDELAIEQLEITWPYLDADDHWEYTLKLAGPLAGAIERLDADEKEAVRADVRAQIEPLLAVGPLKGLTHVIRAS